MHTRLLATAGSMFSWLKRKVEKTTAHYLGYDFDSAADADLDTDIISRKVNHLTKNLMFNGNLTAQEKEDVVSKIGHMAYMGAPEASRTAATCLNEMITLLKSKRTPQSLKEKLIMAISEICYLNRDNQNRTAAAVPTLVDIMSDTENVHMSRLACYCITCIICNNYAMMRKLQEIPTLKDSLTLCNSMDKQWTGWPNNYAMLLMDILGPSHRTSTTTA